MSAHLSIAWECSLNGVYALKQIQKGEWANVNTFYYKNTLSSYQNNNDLHSSLQLTVFKKELGSATGVERYYLRA